MNDDRATSASHSEELSGGKMVRQIGPNERVETCNTCGWSVYTSSLALALLDTVTTEITAGLVDNRPGGYVEQWVPEFYERFRGNWREVEDCIEGRVLADDEVTIQRNEADLGAEVAVRDTDGLTEPGADEASASGDEDASAAEGANVVGEEFYPPFTRERLVDELQFLANLETRTIHWSLIRRAVVEQAAHILGGFEQYSGVLPRPDPGEHPPKTPSS